MMRFSDEQLDIHLSAFGTVLYPGEALQPILARPVRDALKAWLIEIQADKELTEVGLAPRRRAIFDGPPGVGKTTLAHHLAARLGLTMVVVHPERMIDKWLGSTGKNVGKLFDLAAEHDTPIMMFFDEFDALAFKRKETEQAAGAEQNAWVNTLLQRIERHAGFTIAATNHGKSIDPAVWRRFDIHITLEMPGQDERERILARYLKPYGLPKDSLKRFAEAFDTASPALIRQWAEGLKRNIIIGPKVGWDMRRDAVFNRLVASVSPHPDLGKPRLWSHGAKDVAVQAMPWPLPMAKDVVEEGEAPRPDNVVVPLVRR